MERLANSEFEVLISNGPFSQPIGSYVLGLVPNESPWSLLSHQQTCFRFPENGVSQIETRPIDFGSDFGPISLCHFEADVEVLSGWRKISRNNEYEDLRHGETREEYLKPVYTKYGAKRVGIKNPGQIAKTPSK